ncbi:helix-turn-helix domain-containing protein [Lichenibacterium ramalinae]|uniref:helix-turn-helix domain-containing protein n=1 Tax=Lichenibacterium ramalinae TaxID=2316527 RepID=UPI00100F4AC8|nr:helix-turn-helix transcriptional regulator [Lichenibacterium ramalinae]
MVDKNALKQAHVKLLSDEEMLARLRDALKRKSVSLRHLSQALGVPYRSVQNYLGGETRMPASFLINVCGYVGLEPSFLYNGDFRPHYHDLKDAVAKACQVLDIPRQEDAQLVDGILRSGETPQRVFVDRATELISENYDRFRHEWLNRRTAAFGFRGDPFVDDHSDKQVDQSGLPVPPLDPARDIDG